MQVHLELALMPVQSTLSEISSLLKQAIDLSVPFTIELNSDEKEGIRTVAEGREGYVRLVTDLSETYSGELPRTFDETVLRKKLNLRETIGLLLLQTQQINTMLDNTYVGLGTDIMKQADEAVKHLQASRLRNGELDKALKTIDEYNKRFGKKKETDTTTDTAPVNDAL